MKGDDFMFNYITFEEGIFESISPETFKEWMVGSGLRGFEVAVHEALLPMVQYRDFLTYFSSHKMFFNYHVPDFISKNEFAIEQWLVNSDIQKNYEAFFYQLLRLHESAAMDYTPIITFHGAKQIPGTSSLAKETTRYFCDFALNLFTQVKMPFALAIETLHHSTNQFGSRRIEVEELVYEFQASNLGICWDMVHDFRNDESSDLPPPFFLEKVLIGHIHGFGNYKDKKTDHLPLWSSEIDLSHQVKTLKEIHPHVPIVHELLAHGCTSYYDMLQKDLLYKQDFPS